MLFVRQLLIKECMKIRLMILWLVVAWSTQAAALNVAFLVPDTQERKFWQQVVGVVQSVADDHNINLQVYYSSNDRFASRTGIANIVGQNQKPDYVIYRPIKGSVIDTMRLLEAHKISFVTLEKSFSDEELQLVGKPQSKYQHWLGTVEYDDEQGGALLTAALLQQHQKTQPDTTMRLTAIGGGFEQVSLARQSHLKNLALQDKPVVVNQIFPMSWSIDNIYQTFPAINSRYPDTHAFWCVADSFALAILDHISAPSNSDSPVLIGGFDWLPEAIDKIASKDLAASVGGHFLMAANALLKIIEYSQGNNVFLQNNTAQKYEVIDHDNVALYQPFLHKAPWPEIDYRQFSSHFNQQKKPVDLTVANLIAAYSQFQTQAK